MALSIKTCNNNNAHILINRTKESIQRKEEILNRVNTVIEEKLGYSLDYILNTVKSMEKDQGDLNILLNKFC